MFNIGSGEIALIAVVALLILGPKRLPELARGIGKFMREFRRQTDEVRGVVEREFYKMDQEVSLPPPDAPLPKPAQDSVAVGQDPLGHDALGHDALGHSQLTSGMPQGELVQLGVPAVAAPAEVATAPAASAPVSSAEPAPALTPSTPSTSDQTNKS